MDGYAAQMARWEWEYDLVMQDHRTLEWFAIGEPIRSDNQLVALNRMGRAGWEMCGVATHAQLGFYFKRRR